jgi:hypothetical protein
MKTSIFSTINISLILTFTAIVVSGGCTQYNEYPWINKLVKDDTVFGQWFPAGTVIFLTPDNKINYCKLRRNCVIQGHNCIGTGPSGWDTVFYPSGKLKSAGLANTEVIEGIPCAAGSFWNEVFGAGSSVRGGRTYFYENGKLMYAKVAKTIEYQGHIIKKGQHVRLKGDGTLDYIK